MRTRITHLFQRCMQNIASPEERQELIDLLQTPDNEVIGRELLQQSYREPGELTDVSPGTAESMLQAIYSAGAKRPVVHFLKTTWFRYAAILLLIAGTATYLYQTASFRRNPGVLAHHEATNPQDIPPGGNHATLIAGNKKIDLASNKTGITVGDNITYTDGGLIIPASEHLQLLTPRGGQYQLTLPDGTKAWLNASSGIRFPAKFTGTKREVRITGEVYLEVAPNKQQPFIVDITRGPIVEVLGTSFNINAYEDESAVKTVLVEGSVRIKSNTQSIILKPGQQSSTRHSGRNTSGPDANAAPRPESLASPIIVTPADIDQTLAWKNGLFSFDGLPFREVMKQLERWYDLNIVYEKEIPHIQLEGKISRDLPLSELLKALKEMDVHYRMENNKKLVILP